MPSERDLIERDIEAYLRRYQDKELLRFVTVGSVDDGKSTLIGRLLYDTGSVYTDQLDAVRAATHAAGMDLDLSLLTDGLAAEREQGITIDVAYRYFNTEKRKYIIADTPGHVQYTRNMVTGASTAQVALILIDARLGVLQQSRRHAYIASLLGISHLAVCVNKMDLASYDRATFDRISREFSAFTVGLGFGSVTFFPISALTGANCVRKSDKTPWYDGPSVLEFLESVPVQDDRNFAHFRYPVQYVTRPNLDYRGYAGRIASGVVRKGDDVLILPSGRASRVRAIDTFDGELAEAFAPQSVTIRLEDEVDVSRGDMLVHPATRPTVSRTFDSHLVWLQETPLEAGKSYLLKHTTQSVRADVDRILWRRDMDTLEQVPAPTLALNDIGRVTLTAHRPLFFDGYDVNRETGSFILIDPISNGTVAAGMIIEAPTVELTGAALDAEAGSSGSIAVVVGPSNETLDAFVRAVERRLETEGVRSVLVRSRDPELALSAARVVATGQTVAVVIAAGAAATEAEAIVRSRTRDHQTPLLVRISGPGDAGAAGDVDIAINLGVESLETAATRLVLRLRARAKPV